MKVIEPSYEILNPCPFDEAAAGRILGLIEQAGRTAYKSEDKITDTSAADFVLMIRKRGHESVLEHGSITVRFVIDRGVSHELVRHRIMSPTQESSRYCNYSRDKFGGEVTFIRPPFWSVVYGPRVAESVQHQRWEAAMQACEQAYLALIDGGASPQEARSVLPNSLKTEVVVTANPREWRHIFKLRTSPKAHPQMRQVMVPLLHRMQAVLPELFGDIDG